MKQIKNIKQGATFFHNNELLTRGYFDKMLHCYICFSQDWNKRYYFAATQSVEENLNCQWR